MTFLSIFYFVQGEEQKNQPLFDHAFKAHLHTSSGPVISKVFGETAGDKNRPIQVVCTEPSMNINERKTTEKGTLKTQADLNYAQVTNGMSTICNLIV